MSRIAFFIAFISALTGPARGEMIHLFAQRGNVEGVLAELEKGVPVDIRSTRNTTEEGVSPLFIAAKFGQDEVVRILLDAGADPTILFRWGQNAYYYGTPLHVAARWGHLDVVKRLLDAGADPGRYNQFIGTPLHLALLNDHQEIAATLIAAGAPERVKAEPLGDLLATADVARGEFLASGCDICHARASGAPPGASGPNLWGVFGRVTAADPDFAYSRYMRAANLIWDGETLNSYLASPYQFLPGTSKIMVGIENRQDRATLIAYLATLKD